jgi:hypothetical protein
MKFIRPALGALVLSVAIVPVSTLGAQSDLDAFMRDVVAKRDDNWKKLQQYVLDERQVIELRGPSRAPIWGERREYTWYIRDGFFVRSPVRFNGVAISEKRGRGGDVPADPGDAPKDVDGLIRQTRQPAFISSAYFLRFKFEEGKYALVGREQLDGREVLRVEYYPARLFGGTDRRRGRGASEKDLEYDAEIQRLMNKVALVTLWIEPKAHQIVRYTFDNVSFDFLPAQWLVHVDDVHASMNMGQPFPDVWLPRDLDMGVKLTLAMGQFDVHYGVEYHDYKRADVATKVTIK